MTQGPLAGLRVVITRATHQSGALAAALRQLGADPVHVPLIGITDPADAGVALALALTRLRTFDWLASAIYFRSSCCTALANLVFALQYPVACCILALG